VATNFFPLTLVRKRAVEFPLFTKSYPALFLKINADERDKHHATQKKKRKNFTWENLKKVPDDFGGSERRNGRKILINIKVDFKMIWYEIG